MARRSVQRRQQRREKVVQKWAGNEKAAPGRIRDGLQAGNLEAHDSNRLGNPGRYPEQRTD